MMKKLFFIVLCLTININVVLANEIEAQLNNLSEKLVKMKSSVESKDVLSKYPVGSIYISYSSTNPASILGGTWEAFAKGRTLIGIGSNGTTKYETVNATGGNESVKLSTSNLESHNHSYTAKGSISSTYSGQSVKVSQGSHSHTIVSHQTENEATGYGLTSETDFSGRIIVYASTPSTTSSAGGHSHTVTPTGTVKSTFSGTKATTSSSGSTTAFSVLNPYIIVYIWRRTA